MPEGALGGLALLLFGVGAPFAGGPTPSVAVDSFRARLQTPFAVQQLAWQAPESFVVRRSALDGGTVVERNGTSWYAATPGYQGSIERSTFAAEPDGFSQADSLAGTVEFVLGQARAGKRKLSATALAGRPAYRTSLALHPNDCAGLRRGTAQLWLDRETLLPLRYVERRQATRARTWTYTYRDVNVAIPDAEFARPRLGRNPIVLDYGFVRTSPAAAAGPLSYTPRLPELLPSGFELALSGWARRSGITGPEGLNPRQRDLFAAVFRRGYERIDVTQRLAGSGGFRNDPFGGECAFEFVEGARVNGARATYGAGEAIGPHLYWRSGRLLYTLSGPFPKADLVAIAESLRPVAPGS